MILSIGSGYTNKLLSGKKTKGFAELLRLFVSENKPYWNSFASPIDALRTGAILESRYHEVLTEEYYSQWKETCKEFDCLTASIDFAKLYKGKIVDFDELKTMNFTDYIDIILPMKLLKSEDVLKMLKSKFKNNYNQLQFQLLCSGLKSANLVFLSVESYNDEENEKRIIKETDFVKFKVNRDEFVISKIKERAAIFQQIKDAIK